MIQNSTLSTNISSDMNIILNNGNNILLDTICHSDDRREEESR